MEPPTSAVSFMAWLVEQCRTAPTLDFDPLWEWSRTAWDHLRRLSPEERAQALQAVQHQLDTPGLPTPLFANDLVASDCFIRLLSLIANPPPLI